MLQKAGTILKEHFGYSSFKKGQEQIIESILQGRDTLGIMPTGGGKSACYQIPALLFPGLTLVFSPLISLMKDQVDSLDGLGIPGTFINSSLSYDEVGERISRATRKPAAPEGTTDRGNAFCCLVPRTSRSKNSLSSRHNIHRKES